MTKKLIYLISVLALSTHAGCGAGGPPADTDAGPGEPVDAGPDEMPDASPPPPPDAAPPEVTPLGPLGPGAATLAGRGTSGTADGPRDEALFNNPVGVAVGPDGDIYVADFDNHAIRQIAPDGYVTTLTTQFDFARPFGIVFDAQGRLFVQTDANPQGIATADTGTIWEIDRDTGEAKLIISDIGRPRGLAVLSDGRLVLADYLAHTVSLLDPDAADPTPTLLAGSLGESGYVDDTGAEARFSVPLGVAVDEQDNIYVADRENHCVRQITLDGEVTTVAGTPGSPGGKNGPLSMALFDRPNALAIDSFGILYVTELNGYQVRRIDLEGDQVVTLAGTGIAGFTDDEDPLAAEFFGLEGLTVDLAGEYLYIADGNRGEEPPAEFPYHRVRRLSLSD